MNLLDVKHEIFGNEAFEGKEDNSGTPIISPTKTRSLVWNYFKKSIPAMAVVTCVEKTSAPWATTLLA